MISGRRLGFAIFALGAPACVLATTLDSGAARSAAAQDWPAFVLVSGLLLVGVVASDAGLFEAVGTWLARLPGGEVTRFVCAAALVGVVSALLNLDTAAAFLTPVVVHMARKRGGGGASALRVPAAHQRRFTSTARLQLDEHHRRGTPAPSRSDLRPRMAPAWAVALIVTALVVGVVHRKDLLGRSTPEQGAEESAEQDAQRTRSCPASAHTGK